MAMGAVALYALSPSPEPQYHTVIVPVEHIIQREPDTVRTFVDRIRFVSVPPRQVATAPRGSEGQIQEFCKPVIVAATQTDEEPGTLTDPMLLLRSVTFDHRWAWRKDHLLLTGPTNYGDLMAIDYEVRGDWTARTVGDGVLVQYPRTSLLYDVWEGGSQVYTGIKIVEALVGFLK
jgi:hypothetical protein